MARRVYQARDNSFHAGDWIQRDIDHGRRVNNKRVYQHLMCP